MHVRGKAIFMEDKSAKRSSLLKRLALWTVPTLLVAAAAVYCFQLYQSHAAWKAEIRRIEGRGEPVRSADLAIKLDNPQDDAGPLLLEAIGALQEPEQAYLQLMTAETPTRAGAHGPLRDELQANQKSRELIAQAVARPHCRLLVDASAGDPRRSKILKCRALSDLLHAEVLWSLGTGEDQAAFSSTIQGFQSARLVGEESLTESRFTAIAMQNTSLNSLAELLSGGKITPADFLALDGELSRAASDCRCQPTLIAIRTYLIDGTALPRIREAISMPGAPAWIAWCKRVLSEPQVIDNAVYWIQMLSELAAISDQPGLDNPDIRDWQQRVAQSSFLYVKPYLAAAPQLRGPILAMRQRFILARWALRVDRFYRQNGRFPAELSQVCDAECRIVAPDLLFGQPLVLETYERGFVIRIETEEHSSQEFVKNCRFEVTYPATGDLQDTSDVSTQE
ncbi:hypothetical protein CA54_34880 [Symmachiella macrocystis]|uniref:Uncharacterized protein n=1 Tax=Symmachiella macrocystis TaxID=2527985 RepID=A0A5C6BVC0_9PLAN|nr:hypothetical protein [Symmachiella macrocystis]TWU14619.1 hypothetical protein CA54_34880 [Symmachiella macrocystis]